MRRCVSFLVVAAYGQNLIYTRSAQGLPEGLAEAAVLVGRPDGSAEEPLIEAGEVVADPNGDPVSEEAARDRGGGATPGGPEG
jgi:hypothetical protein